MTAPWLSVLMPTYNGACYLQAALDSMVAESDPDIECIAVDDGSTDDTRAILGCYRDRLNLEIVERPHEGNWVANTNLALERARGKFACLLHQDDVWLPGRLAALKAAIARHKAVDLFLHPAWFIDTSGRRLGRWRCPLPPDPAVLDADIVLPRLLVQNFIAIPSPLFRTAGARDAGGMDEALWYTADWDFWLKLASKGRTVYLPQPLAGFRVHAEAQTSRRTMNIGDFRQQHETVLDRHRPDPVLEADRSRRFYGVARLSIEVNVALASRYHGLRAGFSALILQILALGPLGWAHYWSISRIGERVSARLRLARAERSKGCLL